jgi:hypothetical protein
MEQNLNRKMLEKYTFGSQHNFPSTFKTWNSIIFKSEFKESTRARFFQKHAEPSLPTFPALFLIFFLYFLFQIFLLILFPLLFPLFSPSESYATKQNLDNRRNDEKGGQK